MAGIAARGMLSPQEVANDPWMRESNPIMDMLIALFSQTEAPPPTGKHRPAPSSGQDPAEKAAGRGQRTGESMRKAKGPIKARTARRYANRRDEMMRKIP